MVSIAFAVTLMVAMALKHFVADFLLQTAAIARGKAADQGWLVPLSIHAGLHAVATLAVALLVAPATWWLAPGEFAVHAVIDRGKVLLSRRLSLSPVTPAFWWLFGFDQLLHGLTNIMIIAVWMVAVTPPGAGVASAG